MFWLAVQGLAPFLAIASLIVLIVICVVKVRRVDTKGDEAMVNKKREITNVIVEVLYTMSSNIVGGTLLAKTL